MAEAEPDLLSFSSPAQQQPSGGHKIDVPSEWATYLNEKNIKIQGKFGRKDGAIVLNLALFR